MYAFTVGFKLGETTPELLYGPDTPVAKQDADLDQAARLDDGGGYATVEIVYSNGRPKRRVDFTTPEQKAARAAREAEALANKAAAAKLQTEARVAALKAELAELEAGAPKETDSNPDTVAQTTDTPPAPDVPPAQTTDTPPAPDVPPAAVMPEAAALEADAEAAENEDTAAPAAPADTAPKGTVSGKRPAKAA